MVHWTETRRARAALGEALREQGWTLYGYSADQSDSMTDYYCPATWNGCATHEDIPGAVVVCGHGESPAGDPQTDKKHVEIDRETCERCEGRRVEPGMEEWDLGKARQDPQAFNAARTRASSHAGVSIFPDVVSPLGFLGHATGGEDVPDEIRGKVRCERCGGAGYRSVYELQTVRTWPTFSASPKGALAHLERDGKRCGRYSGKAKLARHNGGDEAAAELAKRITSDARGHVRKPYSVAPEGETLATHAPLDLTPAEGVQIGPGTRPGFVEVRFPSKPADAIRSALKAAGYRWTRRHACWYGKRDRLPACVTA